MDLNGKVAVITGASRGIGRATALRFAKAGARVALLARDVGGLAELAGQIGADHAIAVPCDVARFLEVDAAIATAEQVFGHVDVLINNAGVINPVGRMGDLDPENWSRNIDVNLKGVFHGMRAALPRMAERKRGTIINISSGAATRPVEAWSAYCAAKAGALMLTRMGHEEYGSHGVRVLGLSPGTVATDMQREIAATGIGEIARRDWSEHIPPEWAAEALLWMCGSEADPCLGGDISLRDEDVRRKVGLTT